eukprot:COSAG06_NODE_1618_length_8914_cov_10.299830_7_plen_99_part_00
MIVLYTNGSKEAFSHLICLEFCHHFGDNRWIGFREVCALARVRNYLEKARLLLHAFCFYEFSLCLSRDCLGKMMHFYIKTDKKYETFEGAEGKNWDDA